jgi:octaprenyl-diphosphate synthase
VTELATLGRVDLIEVLARAANEMSIGEMRQLVSCDALAFSEADYERLIASKTASLMSAACEMGAVAGDARYRKPLARYGHAVGMAFQIADDLLDYTESASVTGKPSGQDLREHKMTLPLIAALREMQVRDRTDVETFFADPDPRDEDIAHVIALVDAHGGLQYARQQAAVFGEEASAALIELPATEVTEALRQAISYVIERHN